jgi:hypothetical protein
VASEEIYSVCTVAASSAKICRELCPCRRYRPQNRGTSSAAADQKEVGDAGRLGNRLSARRKDAYLARPEQAYLPGFA